MAVSEKDVVDAVRQFRKESPAGCMLAQTPPPSEERIRTVEKQLGVTFPPTFRAFLRSFGAGIVLGHDIDGISDDPGTTKIDSKVNRLPGRVDEGLLQFSSDGGDFQYCFDLSQSNEDGENPVVIMGPLGDEAGKVVAANFLEFLRGLSRRDDNRWING